MAVSFADIEKARDRIEGYVTKTPILSSSLLNSWLRHDIFFKAECLQKVGAFKVRGAYNTLAWGIENGQRPQRVVANSSGNHAQAVAWSAHSFGIPCTIFMPSYSSEVKIQATRSYGAEVILSDTRNETDSLVQQASEEEGTVWIPPYNHEQVIAGQGTATYEALQTLAHIDAVFAPCGGGGLLSGSFIAARGLSPNTKVIGVEPLQANDAAESLRKGSIQRLSGVPNTLADGAMTMAVGNLTFPILQQLDGFYEVDEPELLYWTQWLCHLLKLRIEPTCAMVMGGVTKWLKEQTSKKRVLVVISGGNVDYKTSAKIWEHDFLDTPPKI